MTTFTCFFLFAAILPRAYGPATPASLCRRIADTQGVSAWLVAVILLTACLTPALAATLLLHRARPAPWTVD